MTMPMSNLALQPAGHCRPDDTHTGRARGACVCIAEDAATGMFGELLGQSSKMLELFAILARVSPTDLSVLIEGETGTGKELVARSIHRASARAHGPFVVFDCSAVASNLIESDLFGHERGAFTGASVSRPGAFEEANGGTLFLDELGELPLELQQKLLRCLQSGEVKRVGGRKFALTDVRIIAATNRNLRAEVQAGRFREDLFYRLDGVSLQVPALRERLDDLPLLVEHFLAEADPAARVGTLPPDAFASFYAYRWPGNVRELRNVVRRLQLLPDLELTLDERVGALGDEPAVAPLHAIASVERSHIEARVVSRLRAWRESEAPHLRPDWLTLEEARRELQEAFELDYLEVLRECSGGVRSRAAHWAGVSRQAIQKLVSKHALNWNKRARPAPRPSAVASCARVARTEDPV
jgi:transcriptional regulator with GAF, ATPase, and Fis domain